MFISSFDPERRSTYNAKIATKQGGSMKLINAAVFAIVLCVAQVSTKVESHPVPSNGGTTAATFTIEAARESGRYPLWMLPPPSKAFDR
ncbi:hypothetical protein PI124_g10233 [Phytophthora idaei]|nr:hypothetical protein PI125_g17339 [Phytophthora idaei]KAG3153372.1 hypothetical protein PI126_g10112 [Phytophthora idaei]KAG3244996.1 hypothetical protein PI124_g10233 [Phytophthora idaei]